MAETKLLGVASIQIGAIASDGDVSAAFATAGGVYKDTAEITQAQDADTEHVCEESDDPFVIVPGIKKTTIKWAITDATPEALVAVLGGTATGTAPNDSWTCPATTDIIEKSVKITPKSGKVITIPRAYLKATIDYKLQRAGIFKVNIECRVLTPTKTGVAAIKLG